MKRLIKEIKLCFAAICLRWTFDIMEENMSDEVADSFAIIALELVEPDLTTHR